MASIDDIRSARTAKLGKLAEAGQEPYPAKVQTFISAGEAREKFNSLKSKKSVLTAGRIIAIRLHGGSLFCDISDGSSTLQVYLKEDELGDGSFALFRDSADIGDFFEFKGRLFLTKKKEKTLLVSDWRVLAKGLKPLPEKWHGLQDVEERFRKRYLDLLSNPEVRERFLKRAAIVSEIRRLLDKAGFVEVETPMLHPLAGGASAKPFTTHHNALDQDFFLRIAPELYLKRLLVGGLSKIYELGRNFRNEGVDATHNPEFTMLELYEAFSDAEEHRVFVEKMMKQLARSAKNSLRFKYQGSELDFGKKFASMTFEEALGRFALLNNYRKLPQGELELKAKRFGIEVEAGDSKAKVADKIFRKICRPKIIQPTFILYYPIEILPLAKESKEHPGMADMYQLIAGGLEIVKGFSELNDPIEQKNRFEEQEKMRNAGDEEANRLDEDFLDALEYGMPPAAGLGLGIDRLVMLFSDTPNIREVLLFPTLRSKD
ncbi:MAG: lysine--tRNA ligase [Candidatus Niyogibacteria bacterium]|nr:lysine--tRNA ligase [Candidatus Niyogibacteria bacterium]